MLVKQTTEFTVEIGKTAIEIKLNQINFDYFVEIYQYINNEYVKMLNVNPIVIYPEKVLTILDPGDYKILIISQ